jgi:hypothetical protein
VTTKVLLGVIGIWRVDFKIRAGLIVEKHLQLCAKEIFPVRVFTLSCFLADSLLCPLEGHGTLVVSGDEFLDCINKLANVSEAGPFEGSAARAV